MRAAQRPQPRRPHQQAPSAATQATSAAGLGAQRAAVKPGQQPGYEAQRAALRPKPADPVAEQKAQVAALATDAAEQVVDEERDEVQHPMLHRIGDKVGLGLGILVTRALKWVPGWNDPVVDDEGQDVHHVPGADRVGDHKLRRRHKELVGPKILAYVETLSPGRIRDFLQGVGEGAKRAPGETYRREVSEAGG